jgi:hypothetical protein
VEGEHPADGEPSRSPSDVESRVGPLGDLKAIAALLTVVLLATSAGAAARGDVEPRGRLTVRIYAADVPADEIAAAGEAANGIFRSAGIALTWVHCARADAALPSPSAQCTTAVGPEDIVVRLTRSPHPDAASQSVRLGEALVDVQTNTSAFATVFADRVVHLATRTGANRRFVLGWVMAHEIGHLLLGSNAHAGRGLMRPVWTDLELRRLISPGRRFSASEARRMKQAIAARAHRRDLLAAAP